jgi:hypothetical protein
MFATIGNTVNIPTSPTLVATALPNSNALRPPYDNVTPSVSSAKLDDNASGNRILLLKSENPQTSIPANIQAEKFIATQSANSTSFAANAQTAFLTQLASGDISPEVYGIFVQYDKLVSYANVKYKPSNAGKPVEPVTLFGSLMQLEKQSQDSAPISLENISYQSPEPIAKEDAVTTPYYNITQLTADDYIQPATISLEAEESETLPQLNAYSITMVRNQESRPQDLEVV